MAQVRHTRCKRVQRSVLFLGDDFRGFAARLHVRSFGLNALRFAFSLPHRIFRERTELHVNKGLLAVFRDELFCKLRLCGEALFDFGKARFICRDFFRHNLHDFHAFVRAEHVFQIDNRCCLTVRIREAIAQLVRKLAQELQVFRRQDGLFRFDHHAYEIVIAKRFLELVRFDKHRVAFDKVAIP